MGASSISEPEIETEIWTVTMKKAILWFANAELIKTIHSDLAPCDIVVQVESVA